MRRAAGAVRQWKRHCFRRWPARHAIARIILPGGSLEELRDDATEFEFHQTGSAVERAAHSNEISAGPGGVSAALYWSVCSRKKDDQWGSQSSGVL